MTTNRSSSLNRREIIVVLLIVAGLALTLLLALRHMDSGIELAIGKGDLEKVKARLDANPDLVFRKLQRVWTPLEYAALRGRKDIVELLLARGADVNSGTPLHQAAVWSHEEVVALLLANKAHVDAKDNNGETPLHKAALSGATGIAKLLLTGGADVNARNKEGVTPLQLAAGNSKKSNWEMLRYTESGGVSGHTDIVQFLRQHGGQ